MAAMGAEAEDCMGGAVAVAVAVEEVAEGMQVAGVANVVVTCAGCTSRAPLCAVSAAWKAANAGCGKMGGGIRGTAGEGWYGEYACMAGGVHGVP